jgi:hypothetical protein
MFYQIVPPVVASLLKRVGSLPLPSGTYLAGGTAVTLYYGHRLSTDIDLFTPEGFLTEPIREAIKNKYTFVSELVSERDTLVARVEGVRFSLFKYSYPLLEPLRIDKNLELSLASPLDIAAMKTVAIVQRGTAKDFVDLKMIVTSLGLNLEELIRHTLTKFGVAEDYGYHIRKGLVFFDEAERSKGIVTLVRDGASRRLGENDWSEVKDFFLRFVL